MLETVTTASMVTTGNASETLTELDLPLTLQHRGKVRNIYKLDANKLLFVATDRLSAFDVVFDQGIPDKGILLNELSLAWAQAMSHAQPFHCLKSGEGMLKDLEMAGIPEELARTILRRSMIVERLDMFPIEAVVRGYLLGSAWKEYKQSQQVCGISLPKGLEKGARLAEPIFTPATKAAVGAHDENIDFDQTISLIGKAQAEAIRDRALALYREAASFAENRGLILVDTKFEFGVRADNTLVLADEVLTPDSSRYWLKSEWEHCGPNQLPPSYDKQVVRDFLETLEWDKNPPAPMLPQAIIQAARQRYIEIRDRLFSAASPQQR